MSNDSKPGGMAWIKARLLLRAQRRRRVQSLETWPDSLTPDELACLQYPWEGTPAEKRKAVSLQREMAGLLRAAIQDGEIESVSVPVAVPIYEDRTDFLAIHRSGGIGRRSGAGLMRYGDPMPTVRTEVGEQTKEIPTLTRPGCAAWFRQENEIPSVHIQAWLATKEERQEVGETESKKAKGNDRRRDRLTVAIEAGLKAYRAKHKTEPTAADLWDWLVNHDDTAIIQDATDDKLVWVTSRGTMKDTLRKSFANRMTAIKANNPA